LPDLIFLDLKLPDGDGMDIIPNINKISPQALITIISAYGSKQVMDEVMKKGVYSFIDKPFAEEDILRTIEHISLGSYG